MGKCKQHEWVMIRDKWAYDHGELPFFCKYCLELKAIKRKYQHEQ
jgi:hypothetical protein